jgi:phosphoribosylformylglycinamidine synthase subunit PurQ / glutaminase
MAKKPNIAVVYFPGNNCEEESLKAVLAAGMNGSIVRWNQRKGISKFDGYVIPGGWAYEDRVRAGVIAAKDPMFALIKKEAGNGKPVLGICNGAQALVECGLVPGLKNKVEMALAPNINPFMEGYYCTWINVRSNEEAGRCAFTKLTDKETVIPMPIAHGEGRFVTRDKTLIKSLIQNRQIIFRYSTPSGRIDGSFPTNPNGATYNIAGICNKKGNVLAMMPHPERSSFVRQLPDSADIKNAAMGSAAAMEKSAASHKLFLSMKRYVEEDL